jgi:polysaccharide pyruvyl transferase WcaK-like protein
MEAVAAKQVVCSILVFFSWSHSNIGDIGITPGMIRLLEENMSGVEVTICANSRAEATREYLTSRFPKCKVVATPFRAAKLTPEFREAFDRADLILYNSGTTLSYGRWERNWNRTMPLAMPLVMAREAGKPYGIYCQSFERFQWPSDVMFRPLLSDAAFVFVRDGNSLEYLKSVGIAPPIMEYGPDATFAFDLRDEAAADEFMKRHDLEPRKFITLTVRTSGQGFIDEKREQVHAVKMRGLVETWVRKTGLDVLICPEVKFEIEPARRLIYDPLPADVRKHVRIKESFWLPDEAFSVYGRAHTIVSMEMHSIILGLAAGTPSIHPRFVEAGRKAWMLRDLGVEEWLFDLDEDPADEITSSLLKIHDDYDAALGKVERAMDFVHKRQKETMDVVKRTAQNARKR